MTQQLEITINKHFGKHNPGDRVVVLAENGIALDLYWRRKINDAKENDCISVKVRGAIQKTKAVKQAAVESSTSSKGSDTHD